MKCLITGCNGLIGPHLAEALVHNGVEVFASYHSSDETLQHLRKAVTLLACDISAQGDVERMVGEVKPDLIFHLAAQSLPARSWQDPDLTLRVNVSGTLYLLEAVRKHRKDCRVVYVGSSAEYASPADGARISETSPVVPSSPYGVSKTCAGMLALLYAQAYSMNVIGVRPFFVIGPGRASNAPVDFARRIVEIEQGLATEIAVGNLEAVRDMVDVRDAAKAFWLLAEKGVSGEMYNLCSGEGHSIREVLERLIALSGRSIPVVRDPAKYRPIDSPVLVGDNSKLRRLGWKPNIPLDKTLADILEFSRAKAGCAAAAKK